MLEQLFSCGGVPLGPTLVPVSSPKKTTCGGHTKKTTEGGAGDGRGSSRNRGERGICLLSEALASQYPPGAWGKGTVRSPCCRGMGACFNLVPIFELIEAGSHWAGRSCSANSIGGDIAWNGQAIPLTTN